MFAQLLLRGLARRPQLRASFLSELEAARAADRVGDGHEAWRRLERAHVLSQAYAGAHLWVHWRMFVSGLSRRDFREVAGQLPRLLLAAPGSWLGRAPRGNTGGSNVGIFTPMAIPDELLAVLAADGRPDSRVV